MQPHTPTQSTIASALTNMVHGPTDEAALGKQPRWIGHIDIDAFFPSVEKVRNPGLRHLPVAVGNGVVASCCYVARSLGVKTAMGLREARRICPQLVVLDGSQKIYHCYADRIWELMGDVTPRIETYLDEAYLDLTGTGHLYPDWHDLGRRLKADIKRETGLDVSIGFGSNRMIAKLAGKVVKPDGLGVVPRGSEYDFLTPLPIRLLPGAGGKAGHLLTNMNVRTIGDFRAFSLRQAMDLFGSAGVALYHRARGRDHRDGDDDTLPGTISRETSLHRETTDPVELDGMLYYLCERAMRALRHDRLVCKTIKVRIRYSDFKGDHRSRSFVESTDNDRTAFPLVRTLFKEIYQRRVALRHLGVTLSNITRRGTAWQRKLFAEVETTTPRQRNLTRSLDAIRDRYGHGAIIAGSSIALLNDLEQDDYGYVLRTPSLTK